jgi:rhodanese-related sulfurtransferase
MWKMIRSVFRRNPEINFGQLMQNGAWVVDVRTPEEYHEGHLANSTNYPLHELPMHIPHILSTGKTVITVCKSGSRSAVARQMMLQAGIHAYNGGGWKDLEKILSS